MAAFAPRLLLPPFSTTTGLEHERPQLQEPAAVPEGFQVQADHPRVRISGQVFQQVVFIHIGLIPMEHALLMPITRGS
jgi:hypothetical protein